MDYGAELIKAAQTLSQAVSGLVFRLRLLWSITRWLTPGKVTLYTWNL